MIDLDKLQALCDAATPPPWTVHKCGIDGPVGLDEVISPGDVECMAYCYGGSSTVRGDRLAEDLQFIAAARTALPELIARVRELEARLDLCRRALADIGLNIDMTRGEMANKAMRIYVETAPSGPLGRTRVHSPECDWKVVLLLASADDLPDEPPCYCEPTP